MLDIKTIEWKNFMSYGDYITTLEVENLGPCLITGEIKDDDDRESYDTNDVEQKRKSNGSGKSTLVNVMQWVIFGRTMHSNNPGDAIMNYFTGEDCYGKVIFKNDDYILRTRTKSGHNELIYCKEGTETKLTADTLSTTKNMQAQLNKMFKLDWDLFSNNVFFNQYSKPWLEMADAPRKKALERMLRTDRFSYYAKVAKSKIDGVIQKNAEHQKRHEFVTEQVKTFQSQKEHAQKMAESYEENKRNRITGILSQIDNIRAEMEATKIPDLDKLKAKWDIVKEVEQKIKDLEKQHQLTANKISDLNCKFKNIDDLIKGWQEKSGKMCLSCKQLVSEEYTSKTIDPYLIEKRELASKIEQLESEKHAIAKKIKAIREALSLKTPEITMNDAKETISWHNRKSKEIESHNKSIEQIRKESNPHYTTIQEYDMKINEYSEELKSYISKTEKNSYVEKHLNYIYKAYNDRNKVKSLVFQEHIPFINGRLKHYLDIFGLDIHLELTDSLSIKSSKWGYDFESGGERKRTDVAFMLATFDFHEYMYGRQCNILVLDEVDGRLDDDGISSLVSIINNDIAPKVETIFIISHKSDMRDVFSSQINIIRENRFSRIDSIVK